jgi:methylmalonyl-CoA mutase C-terminal domain/subunit
LQDVGLKSRQEKETDMKKSIRVLIARLGMDAHWRGSIVVARALRDAGMEVIYISNQMPENIVQTALQEDVDVVGLSTLSGNHMILAPEVVRLLREKGMDGTAVVLGGAIPPTDVPKLKAAGIKEIFGPGTSLEKIIRVISELNGTSSLYPDLTSDNEG